MSQEFPRKIYDYELDWLSVLLPSNKAVYKNYFEKIKSLYVIGYGRFNEMNFILGNIDQKPDLSIPSSSIFAIGGIQFADNNLDIVIHQEDEEMIEVDFSFSQIVNDFNLLSILKKWSFSDWNSGDKSPLLNNEVREVVIKPDKYLLVFDSENKKIWMHDLNSHFNLIIPVTNFFNELMLYKKIIDPKIALKPSNFFSCLSNYADGDLRAAFINYNKYLRKLNLSFD